MDEDEIIKSLIKNDLKVAIDLAAQTKKQITDNHSIVKNDDESEIEYEFRIHPDDINHINFLRYFNRLPVEAKEDTVGYYKITYSGAQSVRSLNGIYQLKKEIITPFSNSMIPIKFCIQIESRFYGMENMTNLLNERKRLRKEVKFEFFTVFFTIVEVEGRKHNEIEIELNDKEIGKWEKNPKRSKRFLNTLYDYVMYLQKICLNNMFTFTQLRNWFQDKQTKFRINKPRPCDYSIFQEPFYIAHKQDGVRMICVIFNNMIFQYDDINNLQSMEVIDTGNVQAIFDVEKFENKYYVFDVIFYKDSFVMNKSFDIRNNIMTTFFEKFQPKMLERKEYYLINNNEDFMKIIINNKKFQDKFDGVIVNCVKNNYYDPTYKWKPKPTLDLLVLDKRLYADLDVPLDSWVLEDEKQIFSNFNKKICEFFVKYDGKTLTLTFHKQRLDKNKPNSKNTVKGVLEEMLNLMSYNDLIGQNNKFYEIMVKTAFQTKFDSIKKSISTKKIQTIVFRTDTLSVFQWLVQYDLSDIQIIFMGSQNAIKAYRESIEHLNLPRVSYTDNYKCNQDTNVILIDIFLNPVQLKTLKIKGEYYFLGESSQKNTEIIKPFVFANDELIKKIQKLTIEKKRFL